MLGDNDWLILSITVTGNTDYGFSVLSLNSLGECSITGVSAVVALGRVLLVTQMAVHLAFKHLFENLGMEILKKIAHILFRLELRQKLFVQ
jgi:hypothetical protein